MEKTNSHHNKILKVYGTENALLCSLNQQAKRKKEYRINLIFEEANFFKCL
jgi:hypothetical protein